MDPLQGVPKYCKPFLAQVPLGPFGSKNFATTISPWVVRGSGLGFRV